jgi:biopolymer transport protein ExbD
VKFRRSTPDNLEINLTPLIDCLLFLIIFFMITTTFTKASKLQITLPQATGEPAPAAAHMIDVSISATGTYAVNGEILASKQETSLRSAIEKVSAGNREMPFMISADGNTPNQAVVTVMDVAGKMGFQGLSISTRQPGDK